MRTSGSYRPKQRSVPVGILTGSGWVQATVVVPHAQSLLDFLNNAGLFIKLTDVRLPGRRAPVPFFAIQRNVIVMLVPREPDDRIEAEGSGGITAPLRLACLLEQGVLEGRLDFLVNLRLSDYLRLQTGFLVLRDAVWRGHEGGSRGRHAARKFPVVLLNALQVTGIEEYETKDRSDHPGSLEAQ